MTGVGFYTQWERSWRREQLGWPRPLCIGKIRRFDLDSTYLNLYPQHPWLRRDAPLWCVGDSYAALASDVRSNHQFRILLLHISND